jgi:predicted phosphodiesterase
VDYGPFPAEVIRWFKEHNVKSVFGNHDQELVQLYEQSNGDMSNIAPEEYCWVHHNCSRLSQEDIDYLKSLPETMDFTADGYYYRMSHMYDGRERPKSIQQFDDFVAQIPLPQTDLPVRLILSHTHRQAICQFRDEKLWINPGSASYRRPDDPEKSAHYAVIEDGVISLRAVDYCRTPLLRETLNLALAQKMRENQLRVAFFFFWFCAFDQNTGRRVHTPGIRRIILIHNL